MGVVINELEELVKTAERIGASDIHITSGRYATFRVKGSLVVYKSGKLYKNQDVLSIFQSLGLNMNDLERDKAKDSGISVSESRLRLHFYETLEGLALSVRLIPKNIPAFEDLFLPEVLKTFIEKRTGLVIVTGATGSGKSTTLASLIEEVNKTMNKKIITVEDPIEYLYEDKNSLIIQRELGDHVPSFDKAITQAMREDPDILLVGELRDLETIQSALRMAETGHLVFGTLHTRGAAESFSRIIDVFPGNEQDQIRTQIAQVTQGVISQQLITSSEGRRLPLVEVLVMNSGARGIISSSGTGLAGLKDNIQQNHQKLKSQSFVQSAADLIKRRFLTLEDVRAVFDEEDIKKIKTILAGRN